MAISELLVVSSYPPYGSVHSSKTVGGASYTKQLLVALQKLTPQKITILADKFNNQTSVYQEDKIIVKPQWQQKSIFSLIKLACKLIISPQKNILVSFEVNMFGNYFFNVIFFISLFLCRITGKQTTILLHQVITDLKPFGVSGSNSRVMNMLLKPYYFFLSLAASKLVVFEQYLGNQLNKITNRQVLVVPHLVPQGKIINKSEAKKQLGLDYNKKYFLYFGYIAPYKGVDWLVKNWPKNSTNKLIVGGGINPHYKGNESVEKFVNKVSSDAQEKGILVTGFIPEDKISLYFSACDGVILPYKTFMSSSGPLSLALTYKKPVVFSEKLSAYFQTEDFAKSLNESSLTSKDIVFEFDQKSLMEIVSNVSDKEKDFKIFADKLSESRSASKIAGKLLDIL